tara:strand:- start:341 stop:604 length:264 start_codon:yes stop_codon:yes gene_type:complete
MTTFTNLNGLTVATTFDSNMIMTQSSIESDERVLTISLGRVSKTWSIYLDSKTQTTNMGHNKNLRTYTNKDWDFTVKYFDKKLKELS